MKCIFKIIALAFLPVVMISCNKSSSATTYTGDWVTKSSIEGVARSEAVSFTIGDLAYIATGFDGKNRLKDVWVYDPVQNFWMQKADLPIARSSAVGFSVNTKGYIGTGLDNDGNYLKDFYEYDPAANTWTRKADFTGSARYDAVAFSIQSKGYITTGYDGNYLKDFYEYDPATNAWTQKVSMGGDKRKEAVAFVINDKAYVCTGINNGTLVNDMWQFDPESGWKGLRQIINTADSSFDDTYTSITRSNASAFVINGKGYISTGENGTATADTWEYTPDGDTWVKKTAFERSNRTGAVGFYVKNRGFVVTGRSGSNPFDDLAEFLPTNDKVDNN